MPPSKIITPSSGIVSGQAPAILKGIQPVDVTQLLANASAEQVKALTYSNFALWSAFAGLEVDGRSFEFDSHRYLLPIYLDDSHDISLIKSAQMGATIYILLRLLWFCRHHQIKAGMYFPTADGVKNLSKDRLSPLINSNEELSKNIADAGDTLGLKQITNIDGKISSLYMSYLGGQASKDSVPLDVVAFDEVRLVDGKDIDQALERISHSTYKYKIFMSTAGQPNADIHKRFLNGTQHVWHVVCNCKPDGFVPSECFPDCIVDTGKEVYLRCPKCKMRIMDPQLGRYIARNPKAEAHSYSVSQLISKFISPKEIWDFYKVTTNKSEFYNSKLGIPYIDVDNQPVDDGVIENCINTDLKWANQIDAGRDRKKGLAAGLDQRGGQNHIVIAKRGRDGIKEIVHVEVIDSACPDYWIDGKPVTPFRRIHELMKEMDIQLLVVDSMPSVNEASELARAFPGRVFLSYYGDSGQDLVRWADKIKMKESIRRGGKEIKLKWQCTVNRYQSLDASLRAWQERAVHIPHPDAQLQLMRNPDSGKFEMMSPARMLFDHLKSMIRQKTVIDESTGKFKMDYIYVGSDPHMTHAWNLCNIALGRLSRAPIFSI